MPDETITQKEVSTILKRWHTFRIKRRRICALLLFCVGSYRICTNESSPAFWTVLGFLWIVSYLFHHYSKQDFAKKMTRQEFEILQQARYTTTSFYNRGIMIELMEVYQHINPRAEYLRASIEPQDDTLLRAAAYTDNTPQYQLLRPSNDDEK